MISYMKSKGRLSAVLHALLHMAERGAPMTSDALAECLHTNAVVVRRIMAGLRDAGFVVSERGHGGGWVLARDLASVTLLDVHMAVDEPPPGTARVTPAVPECLVEQAVQKALDASLRQATDLLTKRLGQVTLADLAKDFHAAMANHAHTSNPSRKAKHVV
jgi:Rrf2 family protein